MCKGHGELARAFCISAWVVLLATDLRTPSMLFYNAQVMLCASGDAWIHDAPMTGSICQGTDDARHTPVMPGAVPIPTGS